jgi:formamidopyrimidine-DNA glycosylase
MPELPEVETIVRGLNQMVKGLTVQSILHISPHLRKRDPRLRTLAGDAFASFDRRGKYIIANLVSGNRLLIHLRMSGRILISEDHKRRDRHDHLEVTFRGTRRRLVFRDVRKFGVVQFVRNDEQRTLDTLGVEAPGITSGQLAELVATSRRPIKSLLLDQNVIAGLGNIYVDESLYRSRIHPLRAASSLTETESKRLAEAIRKIMKLAIDKMGTTFDSYSGVNGDSGRFARYLKVYHLEGSRCGKCGDTIEKIRVGGRGTHFCPTCQKPPRRRR